MPIRLQRFLRCIVRAFPESKYVNKLSNFRIPPPGLSTANIPRPAIGTVPYGLYLPILNVLRGLTISSGLILNDCVVPGTLALTFDDGPWIYTSQLLDILESHNTTATFFICGKNLGKGRIDDPSTPWPAILQRMHSKGHQLASHSYTHQDFTIVNSTIQQSQIVYNEMAFRNLFGFFPTYFRPPYTFCTAASGCPAILNTFGYHIINLDVDTKDYLNDDPTLIQNSKNTFDQVVSTDSAHHSYIELSHDVHYNTVINLTEYMIKTSLSRGYRLVTVGECMGDPPANWYRDAGGLGNKAVAVPSSAASSTGAPSSSSNGGSSSSSSASTPTSSSSSSSTSDSPSSSSPSSASVSSSSSIVSSTSRIPSSTTSSSSATYVSSSTVLLVSSVTLSALVASGTSSSTVLPSTSKTSEGVFLIPLSWSASISLYMSLFLYAFLYIG